MATDYLINGQNMTSSRALICSE